MAIIEIRVPSPGESITHVELYKWLVADGAVVKKDTEIAELESEKATLTLVADESGKISLKASEGDSLEVGSVACIIDTSVQPEADVETEEKKQTTAPADTEKKEIKPEPAKTESRKPEAKATTDD
ncbi:MAG TPA: dihydrolipoyllysine-residue succinyltransferase, partial [Porphyromonadaceae bacterium]|nr:dihydrolipoyllysine-residue succinyltransferase [Porphyromonadaceae bacterium]